MKKAIEILEKQKRDCVCPIGNMVCSDCHARAQAITALKAIKEKNDE